MKQFSSFAVIIAIMKICDHSEVIGEMFILKYNAWQMAFRITHSLSFKSHSYILFKFFLQKMYFNWDSPSRKQNRKVISSEFA